MRLGEAGVIVFFDAARWGNGQPGRLRKSAFRASDTGNNLDLVKIAHSRTQGIGSESCGPGTGIARQASRISIIWDSNRFDSSVSPARRKALVCAALPWVTWVMT